MARSQGSPEARASPTVGFGSPAWLADGGHPLDWNGPTGRPFTPFPDDGLDRSIIDHLEGVVRRRPERIALSDVAGSMTYSALWSGLRGLAETLAAETRPGDLIGIMLPAGRMFPLAMLACLAAGRPFVPLDASYPADWLAQVLEDARPAVIIGGDPQAGVRVLALTELPSPARDGWRPAAFDPDTPACVLFTSGSTGRPKGIVNSQRNLLQRVAQGTNAAHINADDAFLTLASLCTIVGVRDVVTGLLAGARVHLLDPQRMGAREILGVVRAEAISILFAFPALLRAVVSEGGERAAETLRLVRVGGDTTLWSDIDLLRGWLAPGAAIQLVYAATEAPMMQWFVHDAARGDDERIPIGYPLPGNRLAIVDEDGCAAAPGEAGELIVASDYVALGLWVDGRCVGDSFTGGGAPGARALRTGDMVRQRADGFLERLGRRDRQVKIRGVRVELDGVEASLRQHPGVRDVGVLARAGGVEGGASLVAYVSAREGAADGLLDDLRALMCGSPAAMRPARFYPAAEIPRLPSSKLDVSALGVVDAVNVERERRVASEPASGLGEGDAVEGAVARVWLALLERPPGGPEADFFDAGGDSLKAISLTMALEEALGLELPLTLINEAPTFAGLCSAIRSRRTAGYAPLVLLKAGEGLPPVFFVHGVGGNVVDLFPIARAMTYPGAVIALQARGLARGETPHRTVEAMASEYLAAIRARQPVGPYYLCGYSFGGLVAFEMARRLRAAGDEVGLVGLFDTLTSPFRWPLPTALAFFDRRVTRTLKDLWRRLRRHPPRRRLEGTPLSLSSANAEVLNVAAAGLAASARYRPGHYPGTLTLFTAWDRDPDLPTPQAVWGAHADDVSVVDTAGGHLSMLAKPNARSAAEALTRRLPVGE